jgi:hypothetical protein
MNLFRINSVVATVTLTFDPSHRFITLFWGDSNVGETTDTRKINLMLAAENKHAIT